MKICTIIGARPQFIKAAMVSRAIRDYNNGKKLDARSEKLDKNGRSLASSLSPLASSRSQEQIEEVIVHTGQHYDHKMSQVFFDQLGIPEPDYHLEIGSASHGDQTGRMLSAIEKVLQDERPDAVLVYGDTNSTLAGSLAAAKLHIPVGHVEGGMRSFNRRMPEEINRVLTDHVARWHFCATETAVKNLRNEGITEGVHLVGDVMHDAVLLYKDIAKEKSEILKKLGLLDCYSEQKDKKLDARSKKLEGAGEAGLASNGPLAITKYALATVHRAENTDDPARLQSILEALAEISKDMPVVLPLHPRTKNAIEAQRSELKAQRYDESLSPFTFDLSPAVKIIEPVSYMDMLQLENNASIILTDSGGMQKEAFWLGVPCVTMRDETEWVETVEAGMNRVVGADKGAIVRAAREYIGSSFDGAAGVRMPDNRKASETILERLALTP